MTKTFERFLRSFSDDELATFAQTRSKVRPPYWRAMQLALKIEASRRGFELGGELLDDTTIPATGQIPANDASASA